MKKHPSQVEVWVEIPVLVNCDWTPPCKGSRNEYGVPMEPDDPGGFEIINIEPCGTSFEDDLMEEVEKIDMDAMFNFAEFE